MLVHAGKYRREIKNRDTTKTKHYPEKANNTKHSKTKLALYSRFIWHRPGNKVGLFYNAPEPIWGNW